MRSCLGNLCGCVSISESSVGIEEQFAVFNRELDPGVHCSPWCLGRRVKARLFLGERAEELTTGIRTQDDVPCCVHAVINYRVPREKAKLLYKKREDFRDFLNTKFCDAVEQLNHTWSSINSGKAAINNDLTKKMQQAAKDYGLEVSHISWKFRREFNSVTRPEEEKFSCYGADVSNTGIRCHLNMLLENPSSHNDLLIAISHRDIGKVKGLLEDGVDANVAQNGLTPLLVSILISEFECTCLLLQHRADANGSALEVYPLGVAAIEGNNKVIQLLVDHQADPNVPTYYGLLPIELSALQGNHEGMSILFPLTKQMDFIRNWSHVGILDYVGSRSAKDKREKNIAERIISSETAARRAELEADYLTALYWHTEVLRVYPLRVKALFGRTFCWEKLTETQKALCDINSCLEIDPQSAVFLQRKAELLLVAKEFVTAQSSFLSAIEAEPTNMERMKEYEEFTATLGEAVRLQALTARG